MAKRNSTSKTHLPRNPVGHSYHEGLHAAIETERARLSQAQAVLECLHLALEYPDHSDPNNQPYYPDVVEIALTLVRESVNRLDSAYIRPLLEAS